METIQFCRTHQPEWIADMRVGTVPEYECYVCDHIGTVKHLNRVRDAFKMMKDAWRRAHARDCRGPGCFACRMEREAMAKFKGP